ncbi:hypothetical protein H9P43_003876 [Blastocladiella emersonii ATCC 22665]|nr:hypothetical protein H9P43_003876 [Blastocladiella emersonii ATCC 22665]
MPVRDALLALHASYPHLVFGVTPDGCLLLESRADRQRLTACPVPGCRQRFKRERSNDVARHFQTQHAPESLPFMCPAPCHSRTNRRDHFVKHLKGKPSCAWRLLSQRNDPDVDVMMTMAMQSGEPGSDHWTELLAAEHDLDLADLPAAPPPPSPSAPQASTHGFAGAPSSTMQAPGESHAPALAWPPSALIPPPPPGLHSAAYGGFPHARAHGYDHGSVPNANSLWDSAAIAPHAATLDLPPSNPLDPATFFALGGPLTTAWNVQADGNASGADRDATGGGNGDSEILAAIALLANETSQQPSRNEESPARAADVVAGPSLSHAAAASGRLAHTAASSAGTSLAGGLNALHLAPQPYGGLAPFWRPVRV